LSIRDQIIGKFLQAPKINTLAGFNSAADKTLLQGIAGSYHAFLITALRKLSPGRNLLFLADSKDEAAYLYDTFVTLMGQQQLLYFPDSFRQPGNFQELDQSNVLLRTEAISKLGLSNNDYIILTYPEALFEKVVDSNSINEYRLSVATGEKLEIDFIIEILIEYGFQRVDFVYEPGQFSIRGAIVDIYSYGNELPFRIQLDDETIESIRIFQPETQLSVRNVSQLSILPDTNRQMEGFKRVSLLSILTPDTQIWIDHMDTVTATWDKCEVEKENLTQNSFLIEDELILTFFTSHHFVSPAELIKDISRFNIIALNPASNVEFNHEIEFSSKPHPTINKHFKLLIEHLEAGRKKSIETFFFSESNKQIERLEAIFTDLNASIQFQPLIGSVHEGFIDEELKLEVLTDHQVFQRYHKYSLKKGYTRDQAVTLKMLKELQPGDHVTHIDYGVGRFSGLETIEISGVKQESVRIFYKNNDILYVSVNALHKISRYIGKEGDIPQLSKLGTDTWKQLKQRTKKRVKDIAAELIKLYAKRKSVPGFAFSPDGHQQAELEASFMYEDTPDQYRSTQEVKEDMERPHPMDRLICGDVGFGKTEVAVRATFKAITDGKQVAILVPTTILALQHYQTFKGRLNDFGVEIEYLNRFKSTREKKEIYERIKSGQTDLVIGTHALLNKEIGFKDLGLLIIDEEQKFGVSAKEKIRGIKIDVDTLTLTATPIPRTLQFSLMAARDLSMMRTPPPNMQPIQTEVRLFDQKIIVDAIRFELARGGQVFFVHDRIKNLDELAQMIRQLIPDAIVTSAHGQMDSKQLESSLMSFINGEIDVLVSTNIIETGLDISNANTMIINNAHHYGLSDLHQLRGRVGRSNRKAYCYLLAPPMSTLNNEARKRLKTIVEFSDLGSGFEIAMRDLDHRGAGNLLGVDQSGFIAEIGYDTFQKILEEAILELKETDFSDIFDQNKQSDRVVEARDVLIETDTEMLIPAEYVTSTTERLALYNELDQLTSESELQVYLMKLNDRFGTLPEQVNELSDGLRLRWYLRKLGIERLVLKGGIANAYFPANPQSPYYETSTFQQIMAEVGKRNVPSVQIKKTARSLILQVKKLRNLQGTLHFFRHLLEENVATSPVK